MINSFIVDGGVISESGRVCIVKCRSRTVYAILIFKYINGVKVKYDNAPLITARRTIRIFGCYSCEYSFTFT